MQIYIYIYYDQTLIIVAESESQAYVLMTDAPLPKTRHGERTEWLLHEILGTTLPTVFKV